MKDDWLIKVMGALIVLIVGTVGAVTLERMGGIQENIGSLSAMVQRIEELDVLDERVRVLEDNKTVIPHAQLSSAYDQYPDHIGQPLELELVDSLHNITFDQRRDPSLITIEQTGSYLFIVAPQVQRFPLTEAQVCMTVWLRVNGQDLANSSVQECWAAETDWQATTVLVLQAILSMAEGETVQVMMRSLPEKKSGAVAIKHEGIPLVPSAILSVLKVG